MNRFKNNTVKIYRQHHLKLFCKNLSNFNKGPLVDQCGWIKLHRKLLEWEWFKTPNMYHFFSYLLLKASHNKYKWQGREYLPGQLPFGYRAASNETGLSVQSIRSCVKRLKSTHELTIESTPQGSVITILNWEHYQMTTHTSTNDQHTINTRSTQTKNEKNEKNEKNIYIVEKQVSSTAKKIIEYLNHKTGKNYRASSRKTLRHINARLNEGFKIEDFNAVIDMKCEEWLESDEFNRFLRPETLFGSKFEGYLNAKARPEVKSVTLW